ncbi:MAG: CarD family transcriptional regulator [Clostridia bacterium]|nr:CarD family transcriptional regulator [Clostridia bacterium]
MYGIGDRIVYPLYGAGTVISIEERDILGEKKKYYFLEILNENAPVMLPVDTCEKIGVRPLMSKSEIEEIFSYIASYDDITEENWNKTYRINMDKLKSGDLKQVGEVLKYLIKRETSKHLSAGEKKMLNHAKQILYSEIIFISDISYDEADSIVRELIV